MARKESGTGKESQGKQVREFNPPEHYTDLLDPSYSIESCRAPEFTYGNEGRRPSTETKMLDFLRHYEQNGYQIMAACRSAGITYSAFDHWRQRYPDFKAAFDGFRENVIHQAYGIVSLGLSGRLDITDLEKAQLAVQVIRTMKQGGTEVHVTKSEEGRVEGISIRFVD